MKIDFSLINRNPDVDIEKITYGTAAAVKNPAVSGYKLDISGTVMDDAAYTKRGRSVQEFMQDAGQQDVALQRNYLAVMSNSMSTEDFEKLKAEGYQPGQVQVEEAVTVLDRIKAALVKAGVNVEGYTDDLSAEKLEKITGSRAAANEIISKLEEKDMPPTEENAEEIVRALNRARELGELSDGAVRYLVENNLEPTIDNIYKAEFSGAADADRQGRGYYAAGAEGYLAKKAEDFNWEQLNDQIQRVIENAGLTADDQTMTDARWLIEKGVPLTEESIGLLGRIRNAAVPVDEKAVLEEIVTALANGKQAGETLLCGEEDLAKKAVWIREQLFSVTDQAVVKAVENGREATVERLIEAQRQCGLDETVGAGHGEQAALSEKLENQTQPQDMTKEQYQLLTARRQLEEIRLQMTAEANLKLLKSGYAIETSSLEELIEELRSEEGRYYRNLFGSDDESVTAKADLFKEASRKLEGLKSLPAAVLGRYVTERELFTVSGIHEEGSALRQAYEKAGTAYETLMTAPRRDMGDSIQKAFRNVDDILEDMELETSPSNRRAVRILGYNGIEITEENINRVKEADQEVRLLISRMTPAVTIKMIREGINPLETNLSELNEQARELQEEAGYSEEKFSEFLWKLEKNQEISPQERESYIGIYRLIHQIEKSDGAVIGSILNQNAEVNLKNLLTAVRNSRSRGMDVSIDDDFGTLEQLKRDVSSISDQIERAYQYSGSRQERYYHQIAEELIHTLDPAKLSQMTVTTDTTLEAMREGMERYGSKEELQKEYDREQTDEIRQAVKAEDGVIRSLLDNRQSITADTLTAARYLQSERGDIFRKLMETAKKEDRQKKSNLGNALGKAVDNLQEGMDSEAGAKEAYAQMEAEAGKVIEAALDNPQIKSIDVRQLKLLHKTIRLAGSMAREEDYEVPVEIGGEMTSIRLKIIRDRENAGQVAAYLESEKYGAAAARFHVSGEEIRGYAACSSVEGVKLLEKNLPGMKAELEQSGLEIRDYHVIQSEAADLKNMDAGERTGDGSAATETLYLLAKIFIKSVRNQQ